MLSRQASQLQPARTVPGAARAMEPAKRFVHLVRSAVNQRRHLISAGKCQPVVLWKLEQWLRDNPYASLRTIAAFPLFDDLARAMPHHAAGQKALAEARCIMRGLPFNQ